MAESYITTKHAEGHPALQHHFENMEQQREAVTLGAVNTGVLILSSFTMALAVYGTQVGKRKLQLFCLALTIVLGLTFLGIKAVEYKDKYVDSLIPGTLIPGHPFSPAVQVPGESFDEHKLHLLPGATVKNVEMFYWIYFAMTGMHA